MKKVDFLPSSLSAVEHLRVDVDAMTIKYYTLPEAPSGIFHPRYVDKCYSFVGGVSGNGSEDYLIYMALRPDWERTGDGKVIDIDTAAFCFKTDDLNGPRSGVALFHQDFDGRTTSVPGYESFTLDETVNDLHSKVVAKSQPLSSAPAFIVNAMAHSIKQFNALLEPQVVEWKVSLRGTAYDSNQESLASESVSGDTKEIKPSCE